MTAYWVLASRRGKTQIVGDGFVVTDKAFNHDWPMLLIWKRPKRRPEGRGRSEIDKHVEDAPRDRE